MPATKKLVIVESPAKAKTIAKYLGPDYEVQASVGHIRDLIEPKNLPAELKKGSMGKFSVDVDNGFEPYYVVSDQKKKTVADLKRALKDADELFLATDEDREGEAIAWHLLEVLKPKVPVRRMVFHEITKDAITKARDNTRELDTALVDAQETRRILDRLYGYEVSPVLWRKVGPGLSAGRVQSAATRLVVDRERERLAFVSASYWDVIARFAPAEGNAFTARLRRVDGKRIATGTRDFDDKGRLKGDSVVLDEAGARALVTAIETESPDTRVVSVDSKPYRSKPAAPFTTSTLQQEAARKLRFSAKQTMSVAQSLYENGHITYMRTDSPSLSQQATNAARTQARALYGADTVPDAPRVYTGKSKNAQEAHEAIRPSGEVFPTPDSLRGKLTSTEQRLYDLIWKRTVASQMIDATGSTATVVVGLTAGGRVAEFSASGTVITVRGFLAAYEEGRDDEPDADDGDERLPQLAKGQALTPSDAVANGHDTSPPARYTEASLVKKLEELGIGRPSTYASILSTIVDRNYVVPRGTALVPNWIAFSVVRLLEEFFTELVAYDFTAEMENDLDRIADGDAERLDWLRAFYFGDTGHPGLRSVVDNLGEIDAKSINSVPVGEGITLRIGRYGPYLEVAEPGEPLVDPETGAVAEPEPGVRRINLPPDLAPDELTPAKARELVDAPPQEDRVLGQHPDTGRTIIAKDGRFGPYVTEILPEDEAKGKNAQKPRTASLFKSMSPDSVDLDTAVQLLALPRTVGDDPESSEPITAQNGRYGPYLKKGADTRTLPDEDSIFSVDLPAALELFAQPKYGARKASSALKDFDADPVSGKPIRIKDGRFGAYVTDGETNATIPRGEDVEAVDFERAKQLLADKRAKGPAPKKTPSRAPAKRATTTKRATKKA
ncbi:type I DNA topoisomerase [uncultured Amnibacterium sp.]|uniref:type I DNA topoisomerase n=1 Tax=uncultured Amnibacterium sp. TaxID=1631851 RepID=UPI0035CC7F10